jgi:uncharacterized protein (TIGR03067 family)
MAWHVLLFVAAGLALAPADKKETPKTNADTLQGYWRFVRVVQNGDEAPADIMRGAKATIGKDRLTVQVQNKKHESTIKLGPSKKPKQIDLVPGDGPYKGKTLQGIYSLQGDTLTICYAEPGKKRPGDFDSPADSGYFLMELKRSKK